MKDLAKENYGNLETLERLGENKSNDYTTEQLLDENLKNNDGESNLEVRNRMLDFFEDILKKCKEKNIAVVSHGAAIKFLLQNYCKYDYDSNTFKFNETIFSAKLESPSVLKLIFEEEKLIDVSGIKIVQ